MGYKESIRMAAKEIGEKEGTFLITGATGLVGSCMIDVLLCANENYGAKYKIYAMSRSKERLDERFQNKVFPIIQDVSMPLDTSVAFDYIVHAASNADPRAYAAKPVETVVVNVLGNKNILDYCRKHIRTKVLLTSSFEVYGKIEGIDVYTEDMSGTIDFQLLRNGYPESKRCAEILLRSCCSEYGVDGVIARLCSIYGPTMQKNDSKAHAQFIRNALKGEDIVLKSEGTQLRSYCYVVDAVRAVMTILFCGMSGESYNVSHENSTATIAEVAGMIADIAGTHVVYSKPDAVEARGFSVPQNCVLDNGKLKALGWRGKFDLSDGLAETIEMLKGEGYV